MALSRLGGDGGRSFSYERGARHGRTQASKQATDVHSSCIWADVHEKGEEGTCVERGVAVFIRSYVLMPDDGGGGGPFY